MIALQIANGGYGIMHTCAKWEESSAAGLTGSVLREENSPTKGLAPTDLPRERLVRYGVEALKEHELLAIVLGTGYRGRTAIFEFLIVDNRMRKVLTEQPNLQQLRQIAQQGGNRTLQEEGIVLVARGIKSLSELQRVLKQ